MSSNSVMTNSTPDRVDFHHSRQRAGVLVDQIADAVSVQADLAVERRVDLRVGEILPGQREVRLRALDLGVGLLLVRRGVVESSFAGCILPDESLLPLILDIRIGQVRFRLLKVGLRPPRPSPRRSAARFRKEAVLF